MKPFVKFENLYILYIYTALNKKNERHKMAVANLKKIDDKLKNIYENQVTVNNNQPFEDRSELLFAQMNFIAMANKQALHLI